jgi:hypothetical protein
MADERWVLGAATVCKKFYDYHEHEEYQIKELGCNGICWIFALTEYTDLKYTWIIRFKFLRLYGECSLMVDTIANNQIISHVAKGYLQHHSCRNLYILIRLIARCSWHWIHCRISTTLNLPL